MTESTVTDAPTLRDATEIGQLVKATSEGSRYVVVLLSSRVNLAVRWLSSLSLRAEPVGGEKFSLTDIEALTLLGFAVHDTGKYASIHFTVTGREAAQTVASMVGGVVWLVKAPLQVMSLTALATGLEGKGV